MTVFGAEWILPVSSRPIRAGWIAVEDGRIAAVGEGRRPGAIDLGHAVILPSLVNAHTHLELSYLHERIPPAPGFGTWVRAVMTTRAQYPDAASPLILEPARRAIADAVAAGTGLFGDISNTLVTVPLLRDAGVPAQVFYELVGFTERDPVSRVREARHRIDALGEPNDDVRIGIAPHAPYSVSSDLFRAIRADLDAHPASVSSVHLGETPDEVELLKTGTGDLKAVLEELGRWPAQWPVPGVSPVEYLMGMQVLDARMLAVHGVQFTPGDLRRIVSAGTTVVCCPRSNRYVGVGDPPLAAFYASRVPVAFGTDSLASVGDLSLFSELAAARGLAPTVPASELLKSATLRGAQALGFGTELGSIEPGRRASLIAVRLPARVDDVEEYLLTGIEPRLVAWVHE